MSDKELEQLDEFKASGEDSMVAEPVTPAGGSTKKRAADKNQGDKALEKLDGETGPDQLSVAKGKSPARKADKGMKESVEEMFAGTDLSEDFKEKATTIFEAAVAAKLSEEVEILEEEFNAKLDEQVEIAVSGLVENVDSYLDYVVENWMEENELAIERGIRAEMAESFIAGLRDLFVEHDISIPEEEVDVVAEMAEELESNENALNETINELIEARNELEAVKAEMILEGYTKDLTETQAEKLRSLAEGISYDDSSEYTQKLALVKEQYFGNKSVLKESMDNIDPVDLGEEVKPVDSVVAAYADAISRTYRK